MPVAGGPLITAGDLVSIGYSIDGSLRAFDSIPGRGHRLSERIGDLFLR
ncbi:MAG: hypothetical protein QM661_02130 [Solimonas sp.]